MENIQVNGQKIWGPPKGWMGAPPPHGTEVFIKNLPPEVSEDELYYLFSTVGRVYEVRLPVHWTGVSKGYAFVRFTKISEADTSIEKLNKFAIRQGRHLKVERSLDNTRLFLSSVPNHKTGEEIKDDLLTVVENVKRVYVYPAMENPDLFRGYAFVEFQSHRDAAIAKRILTPDILFSLFDRKCIAAWANPLPFLNKETLKNINILFIRNVPNSIRSISVRLAVDSLIGPDFIHKLKRINDYAFLTFKDHETAERVMAKIKSFPFILGPKAVQVEWAIPRELANSTKDEGFGKEYGIPDINVEQLETPNSLLKILQDYKSDHPNFMIEDYINMNKIEEDNNGNIPQEFPPTGGRVTILRRPTSNTETLPFFTRYDILSYNPRTNVSFLYGFEPNGLTNVSDGEKQLAKFLVPDSGNTHFKTWLRALPAPNQH